MSRYGPDSAEVLVFTFKGGLLATLAHDLLLRVTGFEIEVDEGARAVRARFDPSSLRVVGSLGRRGDAPVPVRPEDRADIERNIVEHVLQPGLHGPLSFESTAITEREVAGQLTLHGATRPIAFPWTEREGFRLAEVRLDQREYGITPYRALGGALRVSPEVVIRVRLPAAAAGPSQ